MPDYLTEILPYLFLVTGAGIVGGVISIFWSPKAKARSAIQHFAAGAVLAAVATSVIPDAAASGTVIGVLGGFAAGGMVMVLLKWLVLRFEKRQKGEGTLPLGLTAAAAFDTLIDGGLISAGFASNQQLGVLLVAALAIELFFLTISVGVEFQKGQFKLWQKFLTTSGIAIMLLVGAITASFLLSNAAESTIAIVLSFGAAALIYLIAEELLVETIEAEDSLISTSTLFGGFLLLLGLKLLG
jgi:zinc transporter, ZIP family